MGARFRRSINLGGGFRINISKSGIGYRITKTARGGTRKTYSLPGTGLSYVQEKGGHRQNTSAPKATYEPSGTTTVIKNADISNFQGDEYADFLKKIKRTIFLNNFGIALMIIGMVLLIWSLSSMNTTSSSFAIAIISGIVTVLGLVMMIIARTAGVINMEYSLDEEAQAEYDKRFDAWCKLESNARIWQLLASQQVINQKINAGASASFARAPVSFTWKLPYFLKTNVPTMIFKLKKEQLIILPDKLLIINGRKPGAVNYSDLRFDAAYFNFIEDGFVPSDAEVIKYTWKYVNKNGSPDKRYKDNRQLPVCRYGKLSITSASGINTVLMVSNPNTIGIAKA